MINSKSILIIDDNFCFLKAISEFIAEHYPYQIQVLKTAQNGRDGIQLAAEMNPQVILLDLKLPDMHGFMIIPLIREKLPDVIIITMSCLSAEEYDQSRDMYHNASVQAGANAFILKFRLSQDFASAILKKIDPLLNQDGNPSDQIGRKGDE